MKNEQIQSCSGKQTSIECSVCKKSFSYVKPARGRSRKKCLQCNPVRQKLLCKDTNQKDFHGAAKSGRKGEELLREIVQSENMTLIKKIEEFKMYYNDDVRAKEIYKNSIRFPYPKIERYKHTDFKTIMADGYIPELNVTVEIKFGEKHGTTEEKIFFDIYKIKDGIYGNRTSLLYVFLGPVSARGHASMFSQVVLDEKLPVTVILGEEALRNYLRNSPKCEMML